MKIVCTITDVSAFVHAGGSPEAKSAIVEIPDEKLPKIVRDYFDNVQWAKEDPQRRSNYQQLSFSVLDETSA